MTIADQVARAQTAICPGPGDTGHTGRRTIEPTPRRFGRRLSLEALRRHFFGAGARIVPNYAELARLVGVHNRQMRVVRPRLGGGQGPRSRTIPSGWPSG